MTPKIGRVTFEDAAADLLLDFATNKKRSYSVVERRIRLHLARHFSRRRMADVATSDIRAYINMRQTENSVLVRKARTVTLPDGTAQSTPEERRCASNAEINRELAHLKRMYSLAIQAGKLLNRPYIPMLRENNTRTGFFEREQYESVVKHLPEAIQPIITFAYITGWRVASEILPIEWRNVDFDAGEVRLDAGTTKNGEGRTFPMTSELRTLLEARKAERDAAKQRGILTPLVFFRLVRQRTEQPKAKAITSFLRAWKSACRAAGCPDRIPHDLRRTAVRNLARAGVPERVCMTLTGHKTRSVFERYNVVSDGDLKDAVKKLDASATAAAARQRA